MRDTIFDKLSLDIVKTQCAIFQRNNFRKQTIFGHLVFVHWTMAKKQGKEGLINSQHA
jgi:hypothetical protein